MRKWGGDGKERKEKENLGSDRKGGRGFGWRKRVLAGEGKEVEDLDVGRR